MPPTFVSSLTLGATAGIPAVVIDGATRAKGEGNSLALVETPGLSGMERRRQNVTGPYTPGELEISSVAGARRYVATIRAWANEVGLSIDTMQAVCKRLDRQAWVLTEVIGTATRIYAARAADYEPRITPASLRLGYVELTIDVPVTLTGSSAT